MTKTVRKTPTQLALNCLERLERHEIECGNRWQEAHMELRALRERWEKLAFLIIGSILLATVTVAINVLTT
jgi:hypothetical protein